MYMNSVYKLKDEYERIRLMLEKELCETEETRALEVIGYCKGALQYLPQLITMTKLYCDLSHNDLPKPVNELDVLAKQVTDNTKVRQMLNIPDSMHIEDTSYRAYRPDPALVFEEPNYYKP